MLGDDREGLDELTSVLLKGNSQEMGGEGYQDRRDTDLDARQISHVHLDDEETPVVDLA